MLYYFMQKSIMMSRIKKLIEKFPKLTTKRIFWLLFVVWVLLVFFVPDICSAQAVSPLALSQENFGRNASEMIKMISHIVYVFIWPLLVIAGTALDNSLLYGSFLHLDAALWNIWNIMKNFANFALWFVFIFSIVKNLFKASLWKEDPMKNSIDAVKQTLIAWVLVQISWFVIAVLIDLSTILIYAVWGIPLSMLWSYNTDVATTPVLKLNTKIDQNTGWTIFHYYSYGDYNFSPCLIVNNEYDSNSISLNGWTGQWQYIAWREYLYLTQDTMFESGYCALYGSLYKYVESPQFFCDTPTTWCYIVAWDTLKEKNDIYLAALKRFVLWLDAEKVGAEISACFLTKIYWNTLVWEGGACEWYGIVSPTKDIFANLDGKGTTLSAVLEKSKWMVGPLVTMYSSILRYQDLVINPSGSVMSNLFGFVINTFFAFVLFVPIAALAILLIIRIGMLWMVIAMSPILVLIYFWPLQKSLWKNKIFEKFSLWNVAKLIFAPVVVVFAVSLCIVFLSTIFKSMPEEDQASNTLSAFWVEQVDCKDGGEDCRYSVLWLVDVDIKPRNFNHGKDMFVWTLLMFLATWIVRFFMKFAIEFMWETWKNLMEKAENLIKNVPVIPLPWGGFVGISAATEWVEKLINKPLDDMAKAQNELLRQRFPALYGLEDKEKDWSASAENVDKVVEYITTNKDTVTYETLPPQYKATLANLYWTPTLDRKDYNTFVEYRTNNDYTQIINTWQSVNTTPEKGKTNADAIRFTSEMMDTAVRSDINWKNWARGMVWWSIQLSNGVFMVDYVEWTENTGNPQFRIVDRDTYERDHFGQKTIENVSREDYEKNKQSIDSYLEQLQKELTEFKEISAKKEQERTENEKSKLAALNQLGITQEQFDELKNNLQGNTTE